MKAKALTLAAVIAVCEAAAMLCFGQQHAPHTVPPVPAVIGPSAGSEMAPPGPGLPQTYSLSELESLALQHNPTLVQAQQQIGMADGRRIQAGLYPNPKVGYAGDEIGTNGTAGQQGIFVNQLIVTAGKLELSRAKFGQEVIQAQWQAVAQQYRVLNAVRMKFYEVLALEQVVSLRGELLTIAENAVTTTEQLLNVGQANRPDLLQARVEARRLRVGLVAAQNRYRAAWQELMALVAMGQCPPAPLQGELEKPLATLEWESALANLLSASPELQIARAEASRNRFALRREEVEPIPNIDVQAGTAYDYDSRDQIASLQIGVRLPLFDRNQGNIRSAQSNLVRSQAGIGRVELSLQHRLAGAFARYRTNLNAIEEFRSMILPESREAYELYLESFQQRRAAWPQVLVSQRTYFQSSVDYYQTLTDLRKVEVAILGLLLVDGLDEPPGLPSEGPSESSDRIRLEEELGEPLGGRMGRSPNEH